MKLKHQLIDALLMLLYLKQNLIDLKAMGFEYTPQAIPQKEVAKDIIQSYQNSRDFP